MFGDFNGQIKLCAKPKFKFISATDVNSLLNKKFFTYIKSTLCFLIVATACRIDERKFASFFFWTLIAAICS